MADQTSIEWTDATWTPVKGCTRASEGCRNCYAEIMTARFSKPGMWGEGLAEIVQTPQGKDHRWTGVLRFDEKELLKPLGWKKPRKIFVCSTSDLFHEKVQDEWLDKVFAIMALCPQHTFQVLTKRADRMREYAEALVSGDRSIFTAARAMGLEAVKIAKLAGDLDWGSLPHRRMEPLPNVWLGVSVEDRDRAAERIMPLLKAPAAVRWLSCEPLLGPLDLTAIDLDGDSFLDCLNPRSWADEIDAWRGSTDTWEEDFEDWYNRHPDQCHGDMHACIDWIVVGGESGPGARPMLPDWARSLRDQCADAGVPFLFKQWGDWRPAAPIEDPKAVRVGEGMERVGKHAAGRLLDGVLHDGYPA